MKYILSVVFLFLLGNAAAQLPTSGLIGHFPLDNNADDLSGKNNIGQITGGVATTEDRFGNACGAMHFNGTDGYIRIANSTALKSPVNSLTLTAWFKIEKGNSPGNIQITLLSKSGTANRAEAKAQYRFILTRAFGDSYSNFSLSQEVTAVDNNYNAHPIQDDKWYFLAMVYEENWVNIFLNNKLVSQAIVKKPFTPNDFDLDIGRDLVTGKYFNGSLDDIRIYSRGLTPFEVSSVFDDKSTQTTGRGFTLNLPETIKKNTDAGKCSATVSYQEPTASMGCGKAELKQIAGLPSGSVFNYGRNAIVYQGTGSSGQVMVDSFDVIITDNEAPVFKRPSDINANAKDSTETLKIDYPLPVAIDNCPNVKLDLIAGPAPGAEFPVGITNVRYRATDISGNTAEHSFNVTVSVVKDVVRLLRCPNDITVYTTEESENALVKYETPYVEIDGVKVAMKRTKGASSGSLFRVGKSEVVYESGDTGASNMVCRFNVIVKDIIKPIISCPADIIKVCEPGLKSTRVDYPLPKATDSGSPISVKILSGSMTGNFFSIGTSIVKFEAEDESGNKSTCSFKVTIEESKEVIKEVPKALPAIETKPEAKKDVISKPVEQPKVAVQQKADKEIKVVPEIKDEKEERIKQAEKVFLPPAAEKKTETKIEEKPVVVQKEKEPEERQKPIPAPVPELKEKEIAVVETKPAPPVIAIEKPKDTAPAKTLKPSAPPVIKCAENLVRRNDAGKCGAVINYTIPEIKSGTDVKVKQTKGTGSNSFFKTGTTTNTFLASDAWSQTKECSFNVTIKDQESPVFSCPADTVIMLPANRRGIIYYYNEPKVNDNCSVDSLILVAGPKNGCFLEVGVHPFIYKATDASGNYEMCTHSVIIKSAPPVANVEPPKKFDDLSLGSDSINYEYRSKVNDCFLTVFLYDDGEEDNDIVSVIFNGQVIVNKEMIRLKEHNMIKRNLVLDAGNENYLVSKAWNTGKYGLNTLKIDIYEGNIENEKKDLKNLKPVLSKVLHSKPGKAGGLILKCSE